MRARVAGLALTAAALAWGSGVEARSGSYGARSVERPAPSAFSEGIRAALSAGAVEVASGGAALLTIWPVASAPSGGRDGVVGAEFSALGPGSLLGVAVLATAWTDYKGNAVPPGAYTLRYALLPQDGNHMGVALWRDFLLLSPARADTETAPSNEADLVARSGRAAGKAHPAVLSVFPVPSGTRPPAIFENDLGQPTLAIDMGGMSLGLVVRGEGEH